MVSVGKKQVKRFFFLKKKTSEHMKSCMKQKLNKLWL